MDKQKISKILIITSIATGVTLTGAFLIYKRNKENKQFKRNSHSNFSITIHLSKDQVQNKEDSDDSKKSKIIVEGEEEQDLDEYIASLPTREEKNFFLNLFDKFINIFSKKENISDANSTVIITKPNEAAITTVSSLDDSVEIDNNNTIIITKPNEAVTNVNTASTLTAANTMTNIAASSSLDGPITDIKVLNDVIEQTIHLMNSSGNESDSSNHSHRSNASSSIHRNFSRTILAPSSTTKHSPHSHQNSHRSSLNSIPNGPLSGQSSTSTLIGKRDFSDDIPLTNTASYDDDYYSISQMTTETDVLLQQAVEDEAVDADSEEEEDDLDEVEEEIHYSNPNTPAASRKRTETITNFNYKMNNNSNNNNNNNRSNSPSSSSNSNNNESIDSENENITPSTPKLKSAQYLSFSPLNSRTPTAAASSAAVNNNSNGNNNTKTDNDSINPLSIDINNILMSPNFEFSDEDEGATPIEDENPAMLSKTGTTAGRTLHRSSSISSTATFQSASSSWTDGQLPEEHPEVKEPVNDETWEVQSACSSTSGFYSAQEEFFDPSFD